MIKIKMTHNFEQVKMAVDKAKYLPFVAIIFIGLVNRSRTDLVNPLKSIEELLNNYKEHFPNLIDELSKLSEADVKHQLELGDQNEDKNLNATELMDKYGYKNEIHFVHTEDGYIPSIYRIPGKGQPVLLVHGLFNSAVDWLTVGPIKALPYLLADNGYDVWIGNARGTVADARRHVKISAEKDAVQYWDFSWDEIGRYDLLAMIDYILKETGHSKLKYVGHSQGTTSFFVLCSERPDYNDKISLAVALAPVAWMSHIVNPLVRLVVPIQRPVSIIAQNIFGINELDLNNPLFKMLTKVICGDTVTATLICGNVIFALLGFDSAQFNVTNWPVIQAHTPSAVSTKQVFHYGQEVNSGKFRRYDHGQVTNLAKYGTSEPPDYPVEKVSAPVALFYKEGNSDWESAPADVEILRKKLKNVVDVYNVSLKTFSHTDYLWGKDVKELVYNRILKLFQKYE